MDQLTFSPAALEALSFLAKHLTEQKSYKRHIPSVTSLGEPINEVKQLAVYMGVSERVAAAYALESKNEELKADAVETLVPGIYNAFEDAYEPVYHYAYDIASRVDLGESKRIRMVRTASGVRKFQQSLGSIIISEGEQPLDALRATQNDVPGYDKLVDKQGNSYYVGFENGKWVIRSGQSKAVLFQSSNKNQGQADAIYWLNSRLGGSRKQTGGNKSVGDEMETKHKFTSMSVRRLGKQGHAFRNSNGEYSYPIANVADLKNAIQAFGRASQADRSKLKAYIKRRATALKRADLIPDDWKTGEPMDLEEKDWNLSPKKNWVENSGGLPRYIERVAKAIFRGGKHSRSQAIAIAVSRIKRWATGVGVDADTQAKAAAALAEWEKLKARNKARVLAKRK